MKRLTREPMNSILCEEALNLLDELNIGAFIVDVHRNVRSINYSAQALMGLGASEVIGRECREVFCGVPCLVECLFKDKEPNAGRTDPISFDETTPPNQLVTRLATPVYNAAMEVIGCLTILQDHSPIAALVDRIHYEERSLKMTLDHLDVGILTVNRGGHITFFNQEAEKITGFNRRQVLGRHCSEVFGEEAAPDLGLLKESIRSGSPRSSRRGRMKTKSGITIPIRANYMALRNEKEAIVGGLATFHDLTMAQQLNQAILDRYSFRDMIGKSPEMEKIFDMVNVVAETDSTVLIEGTTGTGKDLLAKVIHNASRRADKPLVKVNCAAIPDNLLESELFGFVKGAFTGADHNKPGRFQEAHGGTMFLDEIGDLPLGLQAKLLRVLEDREFYQLGSPKTIKVDVRIISATNRRLGKLVEKHQFREDLYYRLNVFRIELPELRKRKIDLPYLIPHILRRLSAARGKRTPDFSEDTMNILLNYEYPGNVRELENILEHALVVCRDDLLRPLHLPEYLHAAKTEDPVAGPPGHEPAMSAQESLEREMILQTLAKHSWKRHLSAASLGIDRSTLWRKMKRYGIS